MSPRNCITSEFDLHWQIILMEMIDKHWACNWSLNEDYDSKDKNVSNKLELPKGRQHLQPPPFIFQATRRFKGVSSYSPFRRHGKDHRFGWMVYMSGVLYHYCYGLHCWQKNIIPIKRCMIMTEDSIWFSFFVPVVKQCSNINQVEAVQAFFQSQELL